MAVIDLALERKVVQGGEIVIITWAAMANGDTGEPYELPPRADEKSVQFLGTLGAGGTIKMQGSNDGTNYLSLTDPQGNEISKTAAAIEEIEESPRFVRPAVTAGDGTTSLSAVMVFKIQS